MPTLNSHKIRSGLSTQRRKLHTGAAPIAIATACAIATVSMSPAVLAQDDGADDRIVVTGSRLIRSDLNAPSPIVNVGEEYIDFSGNVTIEETLNEFPQLVPTNTSSSNSGGGAGVLSANLRNLGATRTLVLVNGKRFTPANTSGVTDLSSIPASLIERIDIITGGASAVYGSDAIAGAVNFILKDDFEGMELNYQYGGTFEGGGTTHTIEGVWGANTADGRGNVVLAGSFVDRSPVFFKQRDFSAISFQAGPTGPDGRRSIIPGGSSNVPGRKLDINVNNLAPGSIDLTDTTNSKTFSATPDGSCSRINGVRFGDNGVPLPFCDPEDRYNVNPENLLLRPLRRWQISGIASYDITDKIEAYTELSFMGNSQFWQQAEASFTARTPGQTDLIIPDLANNPVLSQATIDFFTANAALFDPDGDGDYAITGGVRGRGQEIGPRRFGFERSTFSMTGGLRGEFTMGDNPWAWDTYFQFQRATQSDITENVLSQNRLSQGLDVVLDGGGNAVCRSQLNGCVPVNPFGLDAITPEMANFITPTRGDDSYFERTVGAGSVAGDLFDMTGVFGDGTGGVVSTAFGFEYREEFFDFIPNAGNESGPANTPLPRNTGSFNLFELFMETRVPIIEEGVVHSFALEGAVRYSDYSTVGGVWTYKGGAELAPVDWFRIRAAYNRAIRAPNLAELLNPQTTGFTGYSDPCDAGASPSATIKGFCIQQGVPAATIDSFLQTSQGVTQRSGGNPNLEEERSNTITIGAVISPPFIPNLNIAVDYFDIEIKNAVASVGAQAISDECYRALDLNNPFCQAMGTRLANGQVNEIQATLLNIASIQADGLDVAADWGTDLPSSIGFGGNAASLTLRTNLSWLFSNASTLIGDPLDCVGLFSGPCFDGPQGTVTPDFRGNFAAVFNSGPITFGVNARYTAALSVVPANRGVFFTDSTGDALYIDVYTRYDVTDSLELYGGIDNLSNDQPKALHWALAGDSNVHQDVFDVLGRRFFVGARLTF